MWWLAVDEDGLRDAAAAIAANDAARGSAVLAGALVSAFLAQPLGVAAAAVVGGTAKGLVERVCAEIANGATRRFLAAGAKVDRQRAREALLRDCVRDATEAAVAPLHTLLEQLEVQQKDQFLILLTCITDLRREVRDLGGPNSGVSARSNSHPVAGLSGSLRCGWQIVKLQDHDDVAMRLMDAQEWHALAAHYAELERAPEDRNAWVEHLHRRALVERNHLGKPERALETLRTAFFLDPCRDDLCVELGELAVITHKVDHLIQTAQERLERCNEEAEAAHYCLSLARWHELSEDLDRARHELRRASRFAPRHPRVLRQRGEVFLGEMHATKAEECFREALEDSLLSDSAHAAPVPEVRHDYIREQMALHYGLAIICEHYPARFSEAVTHYRAALGMYSMGQSFGLGIPPQLMTK